MKGTVLVVAGGILFSGCAFGRKHVYHGGQPQLAYRGSTRIALAVHDQRPHVISGAKQVTFVGLSRGGYGNSFDVVTKSGRPLAVDFAETIGRALTASHYSVAYVTPEPRHSSQAVISSLLRVRAPRALLVSIGEWKSDTYNRTALEYDVTAQVLGEGGQQLAQASIKGRDSLGGSFMNPAGHAESAVPRAYITWLEVLLNRPTIRQALELPAPTTVPAPAAPAPVVGVAPAPAAPAATGVPPAAALAAPAPPPAAVPPAAASPR